MRHHRWSALLTLALAVPFISRTGALLGNLPGGSDKAKEGTPTARSCDIGLRLARVPANSEWAYGLELKCRLSGQPKFELARTFGIEVYDDKGKSVYVTETGILAVGDNGDFDRKKPRPPTWLHQLELKVRPPGFEPPLKKFGLEVFRDEQNGQWMYIGETGALGVAPGAGPFKAAKAPKGAGWMHGFELKVRKAAEKGFDKDTKVWGVEVFRDENNGNLAYIGQTGMLAVVPGAKEVRMPTPDAKAPVWLQAFTLTVRKAGPRKFATFGLEVFRNENNGNLIYVSETGSLAVVPGKQKLAAQEGQQSKQPALARQFVLKCRKAGDKDLGALAFGIAVFADANTACMVYISETGAIAAAAKW
jgi:hypothetical protein